MIAKPLADIRKADLELLIANQIAESKTLEYKAELPGSGDGGPVKILRSISSLANTNGGHVLYGVEAKDGIPIALPGLDSPNEDTVRQRIENLCRDGVEPRIPQLDLRLLEVAPRRAVLIVHVGKSWAAPHRVTVGNLSHFYGRNSTSSYPLDVEELRSAFTLASSVADRARRFRTDRILTIESGDTPVPVSSAAKLVLHIASAAAFTSTGPGVLPNEDQRRKFTSIGWVGGSGRPNLNGYIFYSHYTGPSLAYCQYFRTGIVEAVICFEPHQDGKSEIPGQWIEKVVSDGTKRYIGALNDVGAGPPYFIFLALVGVRGYRMGVELVRDANSPLNADRITLPELLFDNPAEDIEPKLRPLFDVVWNAFGFDASPNFDETGKLIRT